MALCKGQKEKKRHINWKCLSERIAAAAAAHRHTESQSVESVSLRGLEKKKDLATGANKPTTTQTTPLAIGKKKKQLKNWRIASSSPAQQTYDSLLFIYTQHIADINTLLLSPLFLFFGPHIHTLCMSPSRHVCTNTDSSVQQSKKQQNQFSTPKIFFFCFFIIIFVFFTLVIFRRLACFLSTTGPHHRFFFFVLFLFCYILGSFFFYFWTGGVCFFFECGSAVTFWWCG
jgi:hypothetical protein